MQTMIVIVERCYEGVVQTMCVRYRSSLRSLGNVRAICWSEVLKSTVQCAKIMCWTSALLCSVNSVLVSGRRLYYSMSKV